MSVNRTGFQVTNDGLVIDKDVEAQLTYTFDWSAWLPEGDTIDTVEYTVAARINDPTPVVVVTQGVAAAGTNTFVELSGGQVNKSYIVTCKITTIDGLIDRRNFKLKVVARSA